MTERVDQQSFRAPSISGERHYTVAEVAKTWNVSEDVVRRIFRNQPGVIILGNGHGKKGKRRYETLRIPQSVLDRVHGQYSVAKCVPTN